jgi:sugar phosphate isomerase/epimerase
MYSMTRKQFLKKVGGAGAAAAISQLAFAIPAPSRKPRIKLGIALSSYTGDYATNTGLEARIADVAAIGAEGIEIISETHIPNYPNPPSRWIEQWHRLMREHKTSPSCYNCRMDWGLSKTGKLTPHEFPHALIRDMELAKRLGFKILQPAWKEVTPEAGSAAELRQMVQRILPYAEKHGVQIALEIHSSSLCNSPVVDAYLNLIAKMPTHYIGVLLYIENSGTQTGAASRKQLSALLPYMLHCRAQFVGTYLFNPETTSWEISDERQRYTAPFESIIPLLVQAEYEGYISSEYEGPRIELVASSHLHRQNAQMRELVQRA